MASYFDFISSKIAETHPELNSSLDLYLDILSDDDIRTLAKFGLVYSCHQYSKAFWSLKRFLSKIDFKESNLEESDHVCRFLSLLFS